MLSKTYNTESDDTAITFTDQNGRSLEIDKKVSLKMLIKNRNDTRYSTEPRAKIKYAIGYGFLSFARNLSNNYGKKLLDTNT